MSSTKKFVFLEGLRGLAALCIMVYHQEAVLTILKADFKGTLAVDLFFLLSGFVITYAYEDKLLNHSFSCKQFLFARIARLYPVYLLSLIVSVFISAFLVYRHSEFNRFSGNGYDAILYSFLLNIFYIPGITDNKDDYLFPLNPVYWSLFYELVINIIFAFSCRYLTTARLTLLVILAWIALLAVGSGDMGWDGGSHSGWAQCARGFMRAFYGIFAGQLLYRIYKQDRKISHRTLLAWLSLAGTLIVLLYPSVEVNPVLDITCLTFVFPLSVYFCAHAQTSRFNKQLLYLGALSYPLYCFHAKFIDLAAEFSDANSRTIVMFGILSAACIIVSTWMSEYFDVPAHRWLKQKLLG